MRRVIFVNRYFFPDYSATSQMLTDLAFYLASAGWAVTVVTSRQRYDDAGARLPAREVVQGVQVHRIATTRFGRANLFLRAFDYASFYVSSWLVLRRLVEPGTVVVAKTDPPLVSVIADRACRGRGALLVNWIQDLFPEVAERLGTLKPGWFTAILRRLRNESLRPAKINVAISVGMKKILDGWGVPARVRENWADGLAIRPVDPADNPLRAEWSLGDSFVIGYSGNLGRAHPFDTILQAMEILAGDPGIRFVIVGGGRHLESVQQFVTSRRLTNVLFKPYQRRERLSESLGVADVHLISLAPAVEGLILPSKFYGIAAAGRATIYVGDPDGEIPRLLDQYGCGIPVASGEPARLATVIRELAATPQRGAAMGRRARALFEERFGAGIALRDWAQILDSVRGN